MIDVIDGGTGISYEKLQNVALGPQNAWVLKKRGE